MEKTCAPSERHPSRDRARGADDQCVGAIISVYRPSKSGKSRERTKVQPDAERGGEYGRLQSSGGRRGERMNAGGCGRMRENADGCGWVRESRPAFSVNAERRAARVGQPASTQTLLQNEALAAYIMPPIPPMPPSAAPVPQLQPFFSGRSAMRHSVVSMRPAIEAAFCRAERVTFVGSTTPLVSRSS